ncbi:hypothetical protein JR334_07140 [Clostridia bacterium]|nr:hypothetical protein JR334_07140 [Clostridia bacterium]
MSKRKAKNCKNCEYFTANRTGAYCEIKEITINDDFAKKCSDFTEILETDITVKEMYKAGRKNKEYSKRLDSL